MAEVRGRLITLTGSLMGLYKDALAKADDLLFQRTGKHHNELDPAGWYDAKLWDAFMESYAQASASKEAAIVTLGKAIYPKIKAMGVLPATLKTPLDYIKYEAENFQVDHRGPDVKPRKFIRADDHDVLVEATAPGYNPKLYEGVFLGILTMVGVTTGKVEQTKSTRKGDPVDEFHITW